MATDLTPQVCNTCAHATVCPVRETFLKIYAAREHVMVKCGDGYGNPDMSGDEMTIRIEHRYLDGPGLEKLYHDLGLHGPSFPCLRAGCCPARHNPFDSPILAPVMRPAGYIEPLCTTVENSIFQNQFIPPVAPVPDQYHASPYPPGPIWSCGSCSYNCKDALFTDEDYAKLGGSIYSTFAIDSIQAKIGDVIKLEDIPIPTESILPDYYRSKDRNPETFTIRSEDDKIIIYYVYVAQTNTRPQIQYLTEKEIDEKGLRHNLEFVYNDLSYIFPALKDEPTTPPDMKVIFEGVVCGPITRMSDDGTILVKTGDFIAYKFSDSVITPVVDSEGAIIVTKDGKSLLGVESGPQFETDVNLVDALEKQKTAGAKGVDISLGNYRNFSAVHGDHLVFTVEMDKKYRLDIDMIQLLSFPNRPSLEYNPEIRGDRVRYQFIVTLPNDDMMLQTCLVVASYLENPVFYHPIEWLRTWKNDEISFTVEKVTARNYDTDVTIFRPICPRRWPKEDVPDLTPRVDEAPDADEIIRPFLKLIGYTYDDAGRYNFQKVNYEDPVYVTHPVEMRYLATEMDEPGPNDPMGLWVLDQPRLFNVISRAFKAQADKGFVFSDIEPRAKSIVVDFDFTDFNWPEQHEARFFTLETVYGEAPSKNLFELLKSVQMPYLFKATYYILPSATTTITLANGYTNEDSDNEPIGRLKMPASGGVDDDFLVYDIKDYRVTDDHMPEIDGNDALVMMLIQPEHYYGLYGRCQSFIPVIGQVTVKPRDLTATLIFDEIAYQNGNGELDIGHMIGYEFDNINPDDNGRVGLDVKSIDDVTLTGERAGFYTLTGVKIAFRTHMTVKTEVENAPETIHDETYMIPLGGSLNVNITAPDGYLVSEIYIDPNEPLLTIKDGKFVLRDGIFENGAAKFAIRMDTSVTPTKFIVNIFEINGEITLHVVRHKGNDLTSIGCPRCSDYVDMDEYPWIKWTPTCENYTEK